MNLIGAILLILCMSGLISIAIGKWLSMPISSMTKRIIKADNIHPESVWIYKGKTYRVNSLLMKNLSQDPETGKWEPTVRYTLNPQTDLVFYRAYTEFLRKFKRII